VRDYTFGEKIIVIIYKLNLFYTKLTLSVTSYLFSLVKRYFAYCGVILV